MKVEIDENNQLIIRTETDFEHMYLTNWYKKHADQEAKSVIRFKCDKQ
jgi:hypothetical protein